MPALSFSVHILAGRAPDTRPAARAAQVRGRSWLWWAGGTAAAAAVLLFCYLRIAGTTPVDSDGAGDALMGWDMLHGNVLLHGWWATDVSFWTTELPQYAVVEAVAGLRPEVVHICAALTYTLLVLLAAYAAKGRATGPEGVARALIAAVVMIAPEPGAGVYLVLSSPDHVGTGVPVLLVLLLLDWAPRRWWVPVAAAVLLASGLIGDPLVFVVGVLPLVAVCLTRAFRVMRRTPATVRDVWYELSLVAAAAVAMIASRVIETVVHALGGYTVNSIGGVGVAGLRWRPSLILDNLLALFGAKIGDVPALWGGGPGGVPGHAQNGLEAAFAVVHLVGVLLVIVAVVLAARRLARSLAHPVGAQPDLVSDLLVVAIVANVAIFVFTYNTTDMFGAREVGPALSLAAALAGRLLGGPLVRAFRAGAGRTGAIVRGLAAALLLSYGVMLGYASAQPQLPPNNTTLAQWLAGHGLNSGLTSYWEATSITLDSGGAVTMGSVLKTRSGRLGPYSWEMDLRVFNPASHRANFVVVSPDKVPTAVTARQAVATFGPPARTYRFGPYSVLVWDKNLLTELAERVSFPSAGRQARRN
jgi:hypothetical protein